MFLLAGRLWLIALCRVLKQRHLPAIGRCDKFSLRRLHNLFTVNTALTLVEILKGSIVAFSAHPSAQLTFVHTGCGVLRGVAVPYGAVQLACYFYRNLSQYTAKCRTGFHT